VDSWTEEQKSCRKRAAGKELQEIDNYDSIKSRKKATSERKQATTNFFYYIYKIVTRFTQ
jgi:hypothetical protein